MQFLVNTYNFWQQLIIFWLMVFYYSRLANEPTGTTESLYSLCGSWVMLQIVSKLNFFIKRPLSSTRELLCIQVFKVQEVTAIYVIIYSYHGHISKCEVIKQNESYVKNIDFQIHQFIVWNSFCILLFSAGQNVLYLWNRKSDFNEIFRKAKLSQCFKK